MEHSHWDNERVIIPCPKERSVRITQQARQMAALLTGMTEVRMEPKGRNPCLVPSTVHTSYWNRAQEKHLCMCLAPGNLEATLLKGIFMIYPMPPEKALKNFGMLYTEFMRELFV